MHLILNLSFKEHTNLKKQVALFAWHIERISLDESPSGAICMAESYFNSASSYSPSLKNEFPSIFTSLARANAFYFS